MKNPVLALSGIFYFLVAVCVAQPAATDTTEGARLIAAMDRPKHPGDFAKIKSAADWMRNFPFDGFEGTKDQWLEARATLLIKYIDKLSEFYDAYPVGDGPVLNVPFPEGVRGEPGMTSDQIADPVKRKEYENAIRENREKSHLAVTRNSVRSIRQTAIADLANQFKRSGWEKSRIQGVILGLIDGTMKSEFKSGLRHELTLRGVL